MPTHEQSVVPVHVGLILDGNRRWAKAHGLPTLEGHRAGYAALREVAIHAADRGIKYLSAFSFSTENWKRTKEEVGYLMDLVVWVVENELDTFADHGIRLVVIGSRDGVSDRVRQALGRAEERTKHGTRMVAGLCFNYGGQQELADAAAAMIRAGVAADEVTPEKFAGYLYHPELPPIDLVIRTSGEERISNFMLWQSAYAELMFVPEPWPAYSPDKFDAALAAFAKRQRRFGN